MVLVEGIINGLIAGSILAMFAASFTLIFGVMDIPNMAHAALFAGGAYVFFEVQNQMGLPWALALVAAVVAIGALSAVIEQYLLSPLYDRDEREYVFGVILVTLGISFILERLYANVFGSQPFYLDLGAVEQGQITIAGTNVVYLDLLIVAIAIGSFAFLYWLNNYTMVGYGLRAIVQDRELANIKGVNVDRLFLIAFVLGAVMVTLAGILYGAKFAVTPSMGFDLLVKAFIIVIIAGLGNIIRAGVAAYALGLYEAFATLQFSSYWIFASEFILLIAFFLIKAIVLSEGSESVVNHVQAVITNRVGGRG
jgi:branched-chain amino acid transport system permease protein